MQQLPLGVRLRTSSLFTTYFPGPNTAAVDLVRSLAPLAGAAPIWLWGPPGVGKTHLLQAGCSDAGQRGLTAAYLPAADALTVGPGLLEGWGALDRVCVDDAPLLLADPLWAHRLFQLLLELQESGGRLLLAAELPPMQCPTALADLASRLNGGALVALRRLDDEQQLRALQLRAMQRGLELPLDTALYLCRRLRRDMGSLCEFLDRLDEASLVAQRRLTIPFVKEVLMKSLRAPSAG